MRVPPAVLISIVLAFISAIALAIALGKSKFKTTDSKAWSPPVTNTTPTWIDSWQVLFLSGPDFKRKGQMSALAIWDLRGKSRIYRNGVHDFCYRDGRIVYKVMDPLGPWGNGTWFMGQLGQEKPLRNDVKGDYARIYDRINCQVAPTHELIARAKNTNRKIVYLLEKDGHLDVGPEYGEESIKNSRVGHVRPGSSEAVMLPLERNDGYVSLLMFYPFALEYLIKDAHYKTRDAVVFPDSREKYRRLAWGLSPDGKMTQYFVPDGSWTVSTGPFPYLTRQGLAFVAPGNIYKRTDGLYLVENQKAERLIAGQVGHVGVSPDGCQLAFSHTDNTYPDLARGEALRTLKVIKICSEQR